MLADLQDSSIHSGSLIPNVQRPATFFYELLEFITDELPRWRDRPERKKETAETALTSQLCAHLNSAARHTYDFLQFRIEEPDELVKGRKIDLVPAPCGAKVWVDGRSYVDFEPFLPIECKRLPTPKDSNRDEREYVFNKHATTGGIQRFKAGHHGARHPLGAMIAYVQQETISFWKEQVGKWINELAEAGQKGWTANDLLHLEKNDILRRIAVLKSSHTRENGLSELKLRHLWIEMN
jgi:hypothetical protein